jgi:coatomer protein complex subunit gamma
MVYLVLKELAKLSEDLIIAIAILTKDASAPSEMYRANSIRVISRIIDTAMLQQVERGFKTSIVDKDPYVQSSALVSGIHLMQKSGDVVRKWLSEIQQALASGNTMSQYHALGLLYQIRAHDQIAIQKLVHSLTRNNTVRSPLAHILLIRFACRVMTEADGRRDPALFEYVEFCLRNKSELVVYEAARQIVDLPNVTMKELESAISVLQLFLTNSKATLRFAAVKTINKVAGMFPSAIASSCCFEMENLITDVNRSVATLAITTLLQVESESSVDRLLKQISGFIADVSDEYKIIVIDAIRNLCLKFKNKYQAIMNVLSTMLRDEGGFEYKRKIVDTFLEIIQIIPDAKERGLAHLCEFIEDCEYTYLATKILHLLGTEGPRTKNPAMYIRYIYNRIILEDSAVRAAAVTALAHFGEKETQTIGLLLAQCKDDNDDQVRDRATYYMSLLSENRKDPDSFNLQSYMEPRVGVPIENLESALVQYLQSSAADHQAFDITAVSAERAAPKKQANTAIDILSGKPTAGSSNAAETAAATAAVAAVNLDEFQDLGPIFKSSALQPLTESETEYQVACVRHAFAESGHIVFQFNITNTLEVQAIGNITIALEAPASEGRRFVTTRSIPCAKLLVGGESGVAFVALRLPINDDGQFNPTTTLQATMKFDAYDADASGEVDETSKFQDEYQINDIEITAADYMKKVFVTNFAERWEELGADSEGLVTFALTTAKSIKDSVTQILGYLGMQPIDRTDEVPEKRTKHILYASGEHMSTPGQPALARARIKLNNPEHGGGVAVELCIRSTNPDLSLALANALIAS